MNKKMMIGIGKYTVYVLLLLLLYILQATPYLFEIFGVKPHLVIPAVVCIAIFEGEFAGGLLGAFGGLLCDFGATSFFGFYTLQLMVLCVAVGLGMLYMIKNTFLNGMFLCAAVLLWMGFSEFFFQYVIWGYAHSWMVLVYKILPAVLYSMVFAALFYRGEQKLYEYFLDKLQG